MAERHKINFTSMGRNPNFELTCGFPRCSHWKDEGWCHHPSNRVAPSEGWPSGFPPCTRSTGECDLHTSNTPSAAAPATSADGVTEDQRG